MVGGRGLESRVGLLIAAANDGSEPRSTVGSATRLGVSVCSKKAPGCRVAKRHGPEPARAFVGLKPGWSANDASGHKTILL